MDIGACAEYLIVTANSEEGLTRVANEYVARAGGDLAQRKTSLRWSTGDSPYQDRAQIFLSRSRALRDAGPDPYDDSPESDAWWTLVYDAAAQGLAELDCEGAFGVELDARASSSASGGDQSDEEKLDFVRSLNPPDVAKRFARELDQENKAFEALSKAPRRE